MLDDARPRLTARRERTVGVVLGLSLIGLRLQASPDVVVKVIPDVMLDASSLRGVPLVYREYRLVARGGWTF